MSNSLLGKIVNLNRSQRHDTDNKGWLVIAEDDTFVSVTHNLGGYTTERKSQVTIEDRDVQCY